MPPKEQGTNGTPPARARILARLSLLRQQRLAGRAPEEELQKIESLVEWYNKQRILLGERRLDVFLATSFPPEEGPRVWRGALDTGAFPGDDAYVSMVKEWSALTRDLIDADSVSESWEENGDHGRVTVSFAVADERRELTLEGHGEHINFELVDAVNAVLPSPGPRFEVADVPDESDLVLLFIDETDRRSLENDGWHFRSRERASGPSSLPSTAPARLTLQATGPLPPLGGWPQDGGGPSHESARADWSGSPRPRKVFVDFGASTGDKLVVQDGVAVARMDDGGLCAVDIERVRGLWNFAGSGNRERFLFTSPAITQDGQLLALTVGPMLTSFGLRDGRMRWKKPIEAWTLSPPAILGRSAFVLATKRVESVLLALDTAAGEIRWEMRGVSSPPSLGPDGLVVDGPSGVSSLDPDDGEQRWAFQPRYVVRSPAVVSGDLVFVAAARGYLYALEAKTGRCVWTRDDLGEEPEHLAVGNGFLVASFGVGGARAGIEVIDVATGSTRWSFPEKAPSPNPLGGVSLSRPVIVGRRVLLALNEWKLNLAEIRSGSVAESLLSTYASAVVGLDLSSGRETARWKLPHKDRVSTIVPIPGGLCVLAGKSLQVIPIGGRKSSAWTRLFSRRR